jgi:hypothetical protein
MEDTGPISLGSTVLRGIGQVRRMANRSVELAERAYLFQTPYVLAAIVQFNMGGGGGDPMASISTRYKVKMHDRLEAAAAIAAECTIPKLFGSGSKPHVLDNIPTFKAFYDLRGGGRGMYQRFSQALAQARVEVQAQIRRSFTDPDTRLMMTCALEESAAFLSELMSFMKDFFEK